MEAIKAGANISSSASVPGEWKKSVVINPINVVFKESKDEGKGISHIDILNRSKEYIVFKVKTTEPNNYIVRPN